MNILPQFGNTSFQIKWFVFLYVITIIPCWLSLILALRAIAKNRLVEFISWSLLLTFLLALPYGFVLLNAADVPWQLWCVVVILAMYSYYKLILGNHDKTSQRFWDWYAKSYDTLLNFSPYVLLIKDIVSEVKPSYDSSIRILEIGCGTGNIARELSKLPKVEYLGIDSSRNMLALARKKLPSKNFLFLEKDLDSDPIGFNGQFNIIIINNVLYALKDYKKIVSQLVKSAKPNGKIIISEPLRDSSLGRIFTGFVKRDGVRGIVRIIMHLPSFVVLMLANIIITQIKHIKRQNFFINKELVESLSASGLTVIDSKRVYEGQNIMLIAVPARP